MGFTHYWTPKKSSAKKFKNFSDTCKILHDNLPKKSDTAGGYHNDSDIKIGDGAGRENSKPEFSKDLVIFNGIGDLMHETFAIGLNENDWNFCKTARKPYDLLVCACLLAAVDILEYDISSDGDLDDWIPATKFYNKVIDKTKASRTFILNNNRITNAYMKKFGIK